MFFWKKAKREQRIKQLSELRKVELDVRELLRNNTDPFELIMTTVKTLNRHDMLVLHATMKPVPLLGLMKLKGFSGKAEKRGDGHWITVFVHKEHARLLRQDGEEVETDLEEPEMTQPHADGKPRLHELDNRGLQPPEPMVRTLAALKRAAKGDKVVIHNDRVPAFLLEEIKGLGYPCEVAEQSDGSAVVTIEKR